MSRIRHGGFALFLLFGCQSILAADEVRWRYDYTAARRESQQSGRPMFLDFSTEWCVPCKRLDQTTFRDPAVVRVLNEQYVPVKLDGSKEAALVQLLNVQVFPTLILAGSDGRILRNIEGFVDAGRLRTQLDEVAGATATSNTLTRPPAPPVAHAPGSPTPKSPSPVNTAAPLTRPPEPPDTKAQQRKLLATQMLAQARSDYYSQLYICCLDRCVVLTQTYSDLPEAVEAGQILEHIKANPEWMKQASDRLSERLAEMELALAESWIKKSDAARAAECLEKVGVILPGSQYAEFARIRLAQIRGRTSGMTTGSK